MTGGQVRAKWKTWEVGGVGWLFTDKNLAAACRDDVRAYQKAKKPDYAVTMQARTVKTNTYRLPIWVVTVRKRAT